MRSSCAKLLVTVILSFVLLVTAVTLAVAAPPWSDASNTWWQTTYGVTDAQAGTVAEGYPDDTFQPYLAITRGQFAKMAADGLGLSTATPAAPTFSDVPRTHIFYPWIEGSVEADVLSGYPDGTYRPNSSISRQQANSILGLYLAQQEMLARGHIAGDKGNYPSLDAWYAAEGPAILAEYADGVSVPTVHRAPTARLIFHEVVKGSIIGGNASLHPGSSLTRAQAVALILRVKAVTFTTGFPSVTGLSPDSGPAAGGNEVVISGTNLAGAVAVKFGHHDAASFAADSSTQITATAPAGTNGTVVDVTVITAAGTSSVAGTANDYAYGVPTIASLSPTGEATTAGGTAVTITGTGFVPGAMVLFGLKSATDVVIVNSTTITCLSPGQAAGGVVDVTVHTEAGTSAISATTKYSYGYSIPTPPNPLAWTVRFETNGGPDVPAMRVPSGGRLTEIPTPMKTDHAFTGWYTDPALTVLFYPDAPIRSDITLYASYAHTETDFKQAQDPGKCVEACDPNCSVVIVSPVALSAESLPAYVQTTAYFGELPELNISGDGGVYTISPATPYPAGGHYRFTLLNHALFFQGESADVRYWDFRIAKDPVNNVQLKSEIGYVLWSQVTLLGNGTYLVPASLGFQVGDTVCFWDGVINDATLFRRVLLASTHTGDNGEDMTLLTTEESGLGDVLDQAEVYFQQVIPASEYLEQVDLLEIAQAAKNSPGTREMTSLLASALAQSSTFQELLAAAESDGGVFEPVEEFDEIERELTDPLIEGLAVTATVCRAINPNFPVAGESDWAGITLTFTYNTVIKDKVEINAVFAVTEYIKSTMQGHKDWDGANLIFDYALNNYTQTEVDLSLLIKSKDAGEDDYLDITKEIEELTKPDSENSGDVTGILDDVLGAKGDDIELVNASLLQMPISLVVFQVNFDVNFVVKVNFAAGISTHTTIMASRQVGLCGSTYGGIDTYSNQLTGNDRYSFDLYCAGYLGFKAGLKLEISLSVIGLPSLGKLGVSGEVGAYVDLYGFMHLRITKPQTYVDASTSLQGGVYMEVGVYVELGLFAKSDWFGAKAACKLLDEKFPVFTMGDRYVLLEFTEGGSVIINVEQYPLYGSAGMFDAEFLDITTGEVVTGDYADLSKFTVEFSSPYFECINNTVSVLKSRFGQNYSPAVPSNTARLDATIYVYYTGSNLAFSHQADGDAVKQIALTWIDSSVAVYDYPDLNAVKATYVVDVDGVEQQVAEKLVPFGDIPGSIDYSAYTRNCEVMGYTNDSSRPIFQDTVYTIHVSPYQTLVSFLTYHGGSWHLDVYAVNIGDVPTIPAGYDTPRPDLTFTGWIGRPGRTFSVTTTSAVTAADLDAWAWHSRLFHHLDTTTPLQSLSGSFDECYDAYTMGTFGGAPLLDRTLYLYEARYQGGPFTVNFSYPAMSYTYCGWPQDYSATTYASQVDFNEKIPLPPAVLAYPGTDMMGWDIDADGTADYSTFAELPRATQDTTLTAVVQFRTHSVTVLDADGNVDQTLTVNCGDLPDILNTSPAYPGDPDGDDYQFAYWAVSKSGGAFTQWTSGSDPGVFADWTIKPVYAGVFTVTFDFAGGIYNGDSSKSVDLTAGTYLVAGLIDFYPTKAADERYSYVFDHWDCGDSFTVTGDTTITAEYAATAIQYTVEFNTAHGTFVTGGAFTTYTGDYDSSQSFIEDFLDENATLADVITEEWKYTFECWDETEITPTHIRYEASWNREPTPYSATFDAGQGTFSNGDETRTFTMPYGTSAGFSALNADIVAPEIAGYTYDHTGWKDQAEQTYALIDSYTIHGDTTFTAVYEQGAPILCTITLEANGGTFVGGWTTRSFSGDYGEPTDNPFADPTRPGYVFDGWSPEIPAAFSQKALTVTAQWIEAEYTVTFDANGGVFADGTTIKTQTYHYMDTVTPPDAPTRADDADYTYEFAGWSPSLAPVTIDCTYTAAYRATLKEGAATGIYVSDGTHIEDINCNGKDVSGYAYEVQQHDDGGIVVEKPLLTITGDGLTFSGSNSVVYVLIDAGCSSVGFDNLELAGAHPIFVDEGGLYRASMLVIMGDPADTITIDISGSCWLENTSDGAGAIWSARPITLMGEGTDPSLSIGSVGRDAIYSAGMEVDHLTLSVQAAGGSDPYVSTYAFTGEGDGSNSVWRFVDCDVTALGMGVIGVVGNVVLEDDSHVSLESYDIEKAALLAIGEGELGYLRFVNFTGEFSASYDDTLATGPAVQTTSGITFAPSVADYNLGGADVALCTMTFGGMDSYYSFAVDSGGGPVPQPQVRVLPY